jgi:hypothetical protein
MIDSPDIRPAAGTDRSRTGRGWQAAMVRAHARACSLSVTAVAADDSGRAFVAASAALITDQQNVLKRPFVGVAGPSETTTGRTPARQKGRGLGPYDGLRTVDA